eukprot:COSAG06_NODE_36122_length_451_cov_1.142045_1_plen_92_part_10
MLSSGSAFESRMDALSREIGSRGRADAMAADEFQSAVEVDIVVEEDSVADPNEVLRADLQRLRLKQLRQRATVEGLDEDMIEVALDADHPKA